MQKVRSFLKSWEFFLIILLAVMCAVFKITDASRIAAELPTGGMSSFGASFISLFSMSLDPFLIMFVYYGLERPYIGANVQEAVRKPFRQFVPEKHSRRHIDSLERDDQPFKIVAERHFPFFLRCAK